MGRLSHTRRAAHHVDGSTTRRGIPFARDAEAVSMRRRPRTHGIPLRVWDVKVGRRVEVGRFEMRVSEGEGM
jgi:hypothetical protein